MNLGQLLLIISAVFAVSVANAKPEKITVCHTEDVYQTDEQGNVVLDDEGDPTVVDTEIETKELPCPAAIAHLSNHDDNLPDTYQIGDAEVELCVAPEDESVELVELGLSGDEAIESLNCGGKPGKAGRRGGGRSAAGLNNDGLQTPADVIHPNIHQNNGPGNAACPQTANDADQCGNMHGIANNPGQSGADPADGDPGFADQLETVHGGIGSKNKNAAN